MDILHIQENRVTQIDANSPTPMQHGYYWVSSCVTEVMQDRDGWASKIQQLTGVRIDDLHVMDATNAAHPSYYDNTSQYEMVVFRKLMVDLTTDKLSTESPGTAEVSITAGTTSAAFEAPTPAGSVHMNSAATAPKQDKRPGGIPALAHLATAPVTFFVVRNALIVVHPIQSRTTQDLWRRLLEQCGVERGQSHLVRAPASPTELMLRLLNGMVDRYMELRTPMQRQLDTWQRELLDPRRPFNNWVSLLDARQSLRTLENLCEEQYDALQEFRDGMMERSDSIKHNDNQLVRINDVMEHVARVLSHTRRLEDNIESTVQIHFSVLTHRTGEIMRVLTVLTAVFMPLTLITGIFGMNFKQMPLIEHPLGFVITMTGMGLLAIVLITFFATKRYLSSRPTSAKSRDR